MEIKFTKLETCAEQFYYVRLYISKIIKETTNESYKRVLTQFSHSLDNKREYLITDPQDNGFYYNFVSIFGERLSVYVCTEVCGIVELLTDIGFIKVSFNKDYKTYYNDFNRYYEINNISDDDSKYFRIRSVIHDAYIYADIIIRGQAELEL